VTPSRQDTPLLTLHADDSARFDRALEALAGSVQISQDVASSYQPTLSSSTASPSDAQSSIAGPSLSETGR
jgi:hypothetical protein